MKLKVITFGVLLTNACMLGAQTDIKTDANSITGNASSHDMEIRDIGNPVTLSLKNTNSGPGTLMELNTNGGFILNQKANQHMHFRTNDIERMRLTNSGFLGIGVNSPSSMLTVGGMIETTSGGIKFPDGTIQTTAGGSVGSTSLELTDYLKIGDSSLYIGGSGYGGEYELYVTDDDLHIQTNILSSDYNTILNAKSNLGNVGIGTQNPTSKLEVKLNISNLSEAGSRITAPPAFTPFATEADPSLLEVRRENPSTTLPWIGDGTFNSYFLVDVDGHVGISQADPNYLLHVTNPSTTSGTAFRVDAVNGHMRLFETDGTDVSDYTQIERNGDGFHIVQRDESAAVFNRVFSADMDANVGIGAAPNVDVKMVVENEEKVVGLCLNNTQTANYGYGLKCVVDNNTTKSLAVVNSSEDVFRVMGDGVVWCTELNVDVKGDFPDYVFDKDYDLMSLDDLKKFVEQEKHLPNIPSAKEVAENGIAVSEMTVVQTEKIEELTLYILELNESMKSLSKQNEELQKRIVELETK